MKGRKRLDKLLSIVLTLAMVASMLPVSVFATGQTETTSQGLSGKGTESEPYLITTAKELELFRDSVNAGETIYNTQGVWVALGNDIDLSASKENPWTVGIGDGHKSSFDGCFDGNGKTIKNLNMKPYRDATGYVCGGLFGYIYGPVVIRNLTLENVTVDCSEITEESHNVGALVGFANNKDGKANISNVTVKGDIRIDAPNVYGVGAIVGYSYRNMGTISNCKVEAKTGSYIKGYSFVGGITGYSYSNATISGCSVSNIDITATSYSAGGIAGIVLAGNTVSGCTVADSVYVTGQANVGSVVGAIASNGIVVENCTAAEPKVGGRYSDNELVQARIGNKYYDTLAKAVEAAQKMNSATVTVLSDVTTGAITMTKGNVTIEGRGKTITGVDGNDVFRLMGDGTLTLSDGLKVVSNTDCCVYLRDGQLITSADLISKGSNYATIQGNGLYEGDVTVKGGTITGENNVGIFFPQQGSLVIEGGTISGATGVYFKSGTLSITGGEIKSTGEYKQYVYSSNGGNLTGDALVLDNVGGKTGYDAITSVSITGGTFTAADTADGARAVASYPGTAGNPEAKPILNFIYGGTFNTGPDTSYLAEGMAVYGGSNNEPYIVAVAGTDFEKAVAVVGGTTYTDLAAAVNAAQDMPSATVTVLSNVILTEKIPVTKGNVTIEGSGKTITGAARQEVFRLEGGTLTLSGGLKVYSPDDCCVFQKGGQLITSANLTSDGVYAAIQGHGDWIGEVTVKGGTITGINSAGIYFPQNDDLVIEGGTISGATGVYFKSGTLSITGGEIKSTGAYTQYEYSSNGGNLTGDALVLDNVGGNTGYDAITSVSITGGTFTAADTAKGARAVASYPGTKGNPAAQPFLKFIIGGTFNTEPDTAYLADNFTAVKEESKWVVGKAVTGVSLDKTELTLVVDGTEGLTATVNPDDAINPALTWSTGDDTVATVDANGVVTAVGGGTTTITAAAGGKSASCKVTVEVPVSSVTLNQTAVTLKIGKTATLTATVSPDNATDKTVNWTSDDLNVATVADGVVTAKGVGTATITVTTEDGNKTAICKVTVNPYTVTANNVTNPYVVGQDVTLIAPVVEGSAFVQWTGLDEVQFVGCNKYDTKVTFKMPEKDVVAGVEYVGLYSVTVIDGKLDDGETHGVYKVGADVTIIAYEMEGKQFKEWISEDKLTFKSGSASTATAVFTMPSKAVAVTATYDNLVAGVTLDKTTVSLVEGNSATLTATVTPADAINGTVTWTSNKASVATVDASGKVTAEAPGTATITATAGGKSATCTVTVTEDTTYTLTFQVVPEGANIVVWEGETVEDKVSANKQEPVGVGVYELDYTKSYLYRVACDDYVNYNGTIAPKTNGDPVTITVTLVEQHYVTYDANGGKMGESGSMSMPVVHGGTAEDRNDATRSGYTFLYWKLESTGKKYDFTTPVTKDITLVAEWVVNTYPLTFFVTPEGADIVVKKADGTVVTPNEDGTYTLDRTKAYSYLVGCEGYATERGEIPVKLEYFIALEITVELVEQHWVTYDANGGKMGEAEVVSLPVADGDTAYVYEEDELPTRSGYRFRYWKLESTNEEYDFTTPVTEDITLVAVWERKSSGGGSSGGSPSTEPETEPETPTESDTPAVDVTVPEVDHITETVTPPAASEAPVEKTETETREDGTTVTTETKTDGTTVTTETKADGSTTSVETQTDGTVITTEAKADGSSSVTTSQTKVEETETGKTTTTTTTETVTDETGKTTATSATVETKEEANDGSSKTTTTTTTVTEEKTETVAAVETTVVAEDGTETTTTTTATQIDMADGSTGTTVVDETGKTQASVQISEEAAKQAEESGKPVTLPVASVTVTKDTETAPTVQVDAPADKEVSVEIPVANANAGTVVVVIDAEGNETILTDTLPTENGVLVTVPGDVTVKVLDNTKEFEDVAENDWEKEAVDFMSARGIMSGTGDDSFNPNILTSRAMVWTMMAKLSGEDTTAEDGDDWWSVGEKWAKEKGISDGSAPNRAITREELAAMLYSLMGKPEVDKDISDFEDDEDVSDWAKDAKKWAVDNGVIGGKPDSNGKLHLDPKGSASRAEVAQMFTSFMKNVKR